MKAVVGRFGFWNDVAAWLKDKFGVSWQIVPSALFKTIADRDRAKSGRVMGALLQMKNLDLTALMRAYESK